MALSKEGIDVVNTQILNDIVYNNYTTIVNCFLDFEHDKLLDSEKAKELIALEETDPCVRALLHQIAIIVTVRPDLKDKIKSFVGEDFWLKK